MGAGKKAGHPETEAKEDPKATRSGKFIDSLNPNYFANQKMLHPVAG
jgi:hypothetical protein